MYLPTCLLVYIPIYPFTHLKNLLVCIYVTFKCYVNDSGYFMSNEIQVWTVDKG